MKRALSDFTKASREDLAIGLYSSILQITRKLAKADKRTIALYLQQHPVRKLQIGCGSHILHGWLNSDISPRPHHVVRLDITKRFPFQNDTFDYIFSEHSIEHVSYAKGQVMLEECFRVLRDGGKIRLSTPDLSFLVSLYRSRKSDIQERYIRWSTERFIANAPYCGDTFVINMFVRNWGHRFIYDEKVLRDSLDRVGFRGILRCGLNESEDGGLRDLENVARLPDGFLGLESVILEGTKNPVSGRNPDPTTSER